MAAGVSDGAIIIDARIDSKGFVSDARKFQGAIQGLKTSVDKVGKALERSGAGYISSVKRQVSAARDFDKEIKALEGDAARLKEALDTLGNARVPTKAFTEARAELQKLYEKLSGLYERRDKMEFLGVKTDSQAYRSTIYDIETVERKITDLRAKIAEMKADGGGAYVLGNQTEQYQQLAQELENVTTRLQALRQEQAATRSETTGESEAVSQAAQGATAAMSQESAAASGLGGAFARVASGAVSALRVIGRFSGYGAVTALKKLAAGAKNAAIQLAKLAGKAAASGLKMLTAGVTAAAKALFGFNRETRKQSGGLNLSFKNILKYAFGIRSLYVLFNRLRGAVKEAFGEMAKQVPEVKASLTRLKSALNGLKGSLATAFDPVLTAVAPALETLINLLTRAINLIGAFFSALTGRGYYYAANGMQAVGNAASNAANDAADLKRQLAGFDDLNILSDKSSGGGGGGGGGGAGGIDFTREDIGGGILDFVESLKEMWENADYEGMGRIIAQGINRAFEWAKEHITWDNVGQKITEVIDAITGAFNGFVDELDWTGIGETIGEGINTIIRSFNLLMDSIDWKNLGEKLAEGLNGLVTTVDWDDFGKSLGQKTRALILTIGGALEKFDWASLGTGLATGINSLAATITESVNSINWAQIGYSIAEGINNLFINLNWEYVGKMLAKSLNSVVELFGEIVGNIKWAELASKVASGINSLFINLNWDYVGTMLSKSLNGVIEIIGTLISEIKWAEIANKVASGLNTVFVNINFKYVGEKLAKGLNGIVSAFDEVIKNIEWAQIAYNIASGINSLFSNINWAYVGSVIADGLNTIVDVFNTLATTIKWGDIGYSIAEGLNNLFGKINWDNVGKMVASGINSIVSVVNGLVSQISWAQIGYDFASSLNSLFSNINWEYVGQTLNKLLNGALDFAISFLENFDAEAFGNDVKTALNQVDWNGIAKKVWQLLKAAFSALGNLLVGLIIDTDTTPAEDLAVQKEIDSLLAKYHPELVVTWGIDVTTGPGQEQYDALVQAFQDGIRGKKFEVPADLNIPQESIYAAYTEYVQEWNKLHPEAPITPILPENVDQLIQGQLSEADLAASIEPEFNWSGWDEEWKRRSAAERSVEVLAAIKNTATDWVSNIKTWLAGAAAGNTPMFGVGVNNDSGTWWGNVVSWWNSIIQNGNNPDGFSVSVKNGSKEWWPAVKEWWNNIITNGNNPDPFSVGVKNDSKDWWPSVKGWWNEIITNGKNPNPFGVSPKDEKTSWWSSVKKWWNNYNKKTGAVFSVGPKNESSSWWTSVVGWWNKVKQTLGFNVKANTGNSNEWALDVKTSFESATKEAQPTFQPKVKYDNWDAYADHQEIKKVFNDESQQSHNIPSYRAQVQYDNQDAYADHQTIKKIFEHENTASGNIPNYHAALDFDNWDAYDGLQMIKGVFDGESTLSHNVSIFHAQVANDATAWINSIQQYLDSSGSTIKVSVGVAANGMFASGGVIQNGVANWWNNVPKYAGGTKRAHGTVFVAGEAGPEIMGHVNGRTEILNKAQLAQAIYGAVVSGMAEAVNALGRYLGDRMAVAANAVISAIGMTGLSGVTYREPLMASGTVLPYDIAAQIAKTGADIQNTLDANNEDLIQTIISVAGQIVSAVNGLRNNSQGAGVGGVNTQQIINEINRRTQMFGASPLQGV